MNYVRTGRNEKVRKGIAKHSILLAVRFQPIRWDANYANMLAMADPPVAGDMIKPQCQMLDIHPVTLKAFDTFVFVPITSHSHKAGQDLDHVPAAWNEMSAEKIRNFGRTTSSC